MSLRPVRENTVRCVMTYVRKADIPAAALVNSYSGKPETRVDSYEIDVPNRVSLEAFIGSFYRGRLFRIERWIIQTLTGHASSDAQIEALLCGKAEKFSAWTLEVRRRDQMIMCDYQSRTCSWFMVEPRNGGTCLRFGSVIKPTDYAGRSEWLSKPVIVLLLPLHGLYSRLLLSQAAKPFRT